MQNLETTLVQPAAEPEHTKHTGRGEMLVQLKSVLTRDTAVEMFLTLDSESRLAGSAGTVSSTVRVSTAMTPRGIPPSLKSFTSISN